MKIDSYSFGQIIIDGKSYTKDVIICPGRVLSPWWRKEGHLLQMDDLSDIMKDKPDILIIGQGYSGVMQVPRGLIEELTSLGIDVRTQNTTDAVNLFNRLSRRRVAAALHLTC